ncbi:hypothetical protein KIN20_024224 [Parelaphostrongylus tenuis]|uniref:TATA element modulatory factor 1 TATA binding domain-containing protein n=1 Tax=Parelaphostrongylus tenuis TaxID=148309 RepID=A0AAD5MWR0_PARTN|nr:hypothetical protein KIN20_024224 [Parelaphostrongylus tenuis]
MQTPTNAEELNGKGIILQILRKTALKTAQQKIDSVLDIRPEDDTPSSSANDPVTDNWLIAPLSEVSNAEANLPPPASTSEKDENWSNAWNSISAEHEHVVDSEPNPIRDECPQTATLFDHPPSSNSSDGMEPGQSPLKTSDCEGNKQVDANDSENSVYVDVDLSGTTAEVCHFASSSDNTVHEEIILHPLPDIVRRNSHQDDSQTVVSSDIEVIRNVDAWSLASSKPATDNMPSNAFASKNESAESFRAQLLHAEQRRNELKTANDTLQSNNVQLQQRIIVLNQQQALLKKELDEKKTELDDLLTEGKRLSEHSGKQTREIRRLRSELAELEKVKSERKRLKEEKARAEETIGLQKEELCSLKEMIKQLEVNAEQLMKEQTMRAASTEAAQKHVLEQNKHLAELDRELAEAKRQISELTNCNKRLTKETELMQSANWSERLAGERANETVATVSAELQEARAHIERLNSQLHSTETRLDVVLNERNTVAESISQANIPLLDEINSLKQSLHREQRASEEADVKMRAMKRELDVTKEQLDKLKELNESLVAHHHQELTVVSQKVQHLERDLTRKKEKEIIVSENKTARAVDAKALDSMKEENAVLANECAILQRNIAEIRDEKESLNLLLIETRQQMERSVPVESLPVARQRDHVHSENSSSADVPLSTSRIAPFSLGMPYSAQHEMSLKRISFLEQEAVRCSKLEDQVRSLKKELQALNSQYNRLLVVDGERLERIEELEHDVIDLRQLLKDQLVAFVEARIPNNAEKS